MVRACKGGYLDWDVCAGLERTRTSTLAPLLGPHAHRHSVRPVLVYRVPVCSRDAVDQWDAKLVPKFGLHEREAHYGQHRHCIRDKAAYAAGGMYAGAGRTAVRSCRLTCPPSRHLADLYKQEPWSYYKSEKVATKAYVESNLVNPGSRLANDWGLEYLDDFISAHARFRARLRIALTHACTFPHSEWGLRRDRVSPQLAHRLHHRRAHGHASQHARARIHPAGNL